VFALFESLGGIELLVVGIGALLLFGKDLPRVAADAGAQFTKLKRSLDATWRDSGLEREMRQIRDAIPRDLSLTDVARTAGEKLAVRLEDENRAREGNPGGPGPVARGSTIHDPLPEPIEHAASPGVDPASEFRPTPPRTVEAPASDPDADGPLRPPAP
jgi:Sec-independent protein translocase protein TatA